MKIDKETAIKLVTEAGFGAIVNPEFTAMFERLCNLAVERAVKDAKPVAWLRDDGMTAICADEKESWIEAGSGMCVEDYTIPVYLHPSTDDTRLTDLLCRIHRDGGHYITEHGIDKAVADADLKIAQMYATDDTALLKWIGPHKTGAEALNELRKAVAEIIGADPEAWPDHGNAPLAIGACLATRQNAVEQSSKDTALLRQALEALEEITRHFGFARVHESTLADTTVRGKAHESMNALHNRLGC